MAANKAKDIYRFVFEKKKTPTAVIGSVILFILLVSVLSFSASSLKGEVLTKTEILARLGGGSDDTTTGNPFADAEKWTLKDGSSPSETGYADKNTESVISQTLDVKNLESITLTLTWTDEPDGQGCPPPAVRWINQPDNFGLKIEGPSGEAGEAPTVANTNGQPGSVTVSVSLNHTKADDGRGVGQWNYTVVCGDCGNQVKRRPSILGYTDAGNDWELAISYKFYEIKSVK